MSPKGPGEKGTLAELKVYLSDELDKRFRRIAMSVCGYGRGSISKAATEALSHWCTRHEQTTNSSPAEDIKKEKETVPASITEALHSPEDAKGEETTPSSATPA